MLKGWATLVAKMTEATLPRMSKAAERRMAHTKVIYEGPMRHKDGRERHVRWLRFDIGRFLDRSKYNADGSLK